MVSDAQKQVKEVVAGWHKAGLSHRAIGRMAYAAALQYQAQGMRVRGVEARQFYRDIANAYTAIAREESQHAANQPST